MSFEVYDYHTTNRNVLVTPALRARLYHMKPGQVDARHTHDLGHEVFLILEGMAEFEIKGEKKVLGPGQMCIALADEIHQVRNALPDKPTIMYLSVTPHIQPTHTYWTNDGWGSDTQKLPPRFLPNSNYGLPVDTTTPTAEMIDRHLAASDAVTAAVQANSQQQHDLAAAYQQAVANGDKAAATQARDAMWNSLFQVFKSIGDWGEVWNDFAARTVEETAG